MTLRQSSKTGTLLVTKPVAAGLAGFVASTTEDTSSWSTDSTGNKVDSNYMALSTSSDTTITDCETVYPDLWNRSPSDWKSGSDLVVPPQANFISENTQGTISFSAGLSGYTMNQGFWRGTRSGAICVVDIYLDFSYNNPPDTTPTLVLDNFPSSMNINQGIGDQNKGFVVPVLDSVEGFNDATIFLRSSSSLAVYRNTSLNGFGNSGTWQTGTGSSLAKYVSISYTVQDWPETEANTPLIQLVDNVGNAVGVPEAAADQAGTVKKNKFQTKYVPVNNIVEPSGTIPELSFNNLVIGKAYRFTVNLVVELASTDSAVTLSILSGGTRKSLMSEFNYDGASSGSIDTNITFTADATTANLSAVSFTDGSFIRGTTAGLNYYYVQLEELNNTEETTDFT